MIRFDSDYMEGCIPEILEALSRTNSEQTPGYGEDVHCDHARQLIKDACVMICQHFKQSAVFRIGGDEFALLLQGQGYESMQEVIDGFNKKVEENIKENEVVVSIGHSVLTQEDHQLRDVFERADTMMYERKKELKSMGAKTRA